MRQPELCVSAKRILRQVDIGGERIAERGVLGQLQVRAVPIVEPALHAAVSAQPNAADVRVP